jgi:peptidoglycan-N-acetylglucosamine deacetylase
MAAGPKTTPNKSLVLKITLTFDNGPEPQVTPMVLDCLAKHNLKTTFFVLGHKVLDPERTPLAERASEEGHWIGNHTFSHRTPLGNLDRGDALEEFNRTQRALAWLEQPHRYFRPYGGGGAIGHHLLHPAVVEKLQADRFTCVLWNAVPRDWSQPEGWVERALNLCKVHPWSLVVLHDVPSGAMTRLDEFIRRLKDEGAEFTQEFPPDCLPIVGGRIMMPIEPYVRSGNVLSGNVQSGIRK